MNASKNSKNNNQNKIIINSITDLLKIPIHKLNNSNLENISGEYFDKIYQEAINSENKVENIEETSSSNNNLINQTKSKKRNSKETKIKKEKITQKSKKKQKITVNENKPNNDIIDKKDFYVEEMEIGLPEAEQEQFSDKYKYIQNSQNNKNQNLIQKNKNINTKEKSIKMKHKKINKININPPPNNYHQNYHINNITPISDDKQVYMFGQIETPGNDFQNKDNKYMSTPTPMPLDKDTKNSIFVCPLNKIIFSIVYNSIYGEEVCILGSTRKLGNWKSNEALHLKWNSGNLWKGEIKVEVEDLQDFEFKFVIMEKGKIKYWESGDNNIFKFAELINEFQLNKKGKYNKYEYDYNQKDGNLLIQCHWKK